MTPSLACFGIGHQAVHDELTPEIIHMKLTWADEMRLEGEARGRALGEAQGRALGKTQTLRKSTCRVLLMRFGNDVQVITDRLMSGDLPGGLASPEGLEDLFDRALTVQSIDELNREWDRLAQKPLSQALEQDQTE